MRTTTTRKRSDAVSRAADLVSFAGSPLCEGLEPRQLMSSSFLYSDLADLIKAPGPSVLVDGYNGPIAVIGDIDGDSIADILAGRSGLYTTTQTAGERSGAAVISGKTGAIIRTIDPTLSPHIGWSVAGLGDVDGDGIPDYGVGSDISPGSGDTVFVYSGKTGSVLSVLQNDMDPSTGGGALVARAGDLDGDGKADVLVSYGSRAVVFSSANGHVIQGFAVPDVAGSYQVGADIAGGVDLDGDGTPDWAFTSLLGVPGNPTATRVTVVSGKTGSRAFSFDVPAQKLDDTNTRLTIGPDLTGDGKAELLLTRGGEYYDIATSAYVQRHDVLIFSGADGSAVRTIQGDAGIAFSETRAVSDVNDDGVPDLAVGAPNYNRRGSPGSTSEASDGAVFIYSGKDGSRITIVTDTSGATAVSAFSSTVRMPLGVSLDAADRDGDGTIDLVVGALYSPPYFGPGQSRIVTVDGSSLFQHPIFDGATTDRSGAVAAWGHLGQRGFLYRNNTVYFLTQLEHFGDTDRILQYHSDGGHILIAVAPKGDPTKAYGWIGWDDLNFIGTVSFDQAITGTAPAGSYTLTRPVAVTDSAFILEQARDGATPTVWRMTYRVVSGGTEGDLTYLMDGTPVGASTNNDPSFPAEVVAAITPTDPHSTYVSINGGSPRLLTGFTATGVGPTGGVLGYAQRDGDPAPLPYVYYATAPEQFNPITVTPLTGSEWRPVSMSREGVIAGTYKTADGRISVFVSRPEPKAYPPPIMAVDPLSGDIIGSGGVALDAPSVLAVNNAGTVLLNFADGANQAQLAEVGANGPFLAPADAAMAITDDGQVVVTRNAAGELLVYIKVEGASANPFWEKLDLAYLPGDAPATEPGDPVYSTPYFGSIVTWRVFSDHRPNIAIGTRDGLILIEATTILSGSGPGGGRPYPVETYVVRNLTHEIPGAQAPTHSLVTLRPTSALQLVAGLTDDGELVLYGMTKFGSGFGDLSAWTATNLFDDVIKPFGLPLPNFKPTESGDLIAYVTAWGGLNIAGVSNGHVVAFWTSPGLAGWRYSNLTESVLGSQSGFQNFKNLSVYQTPWGGINIVGNNRLQVYWWTPGLGGEWRFDVLTQALSAGVGQELRSDTMTTYVTPWGGLNIAGLDDQNRLWVYWWTPGRTSWTAETVDSYLSPVDRQIPRTGKLAATVSAQGQFSIFARNTFGDVLRYIWSPTDPWRVENLSLI